MMAMAMAQPPCPEPEFTIICIDNGQRALCNEGVYNAQIKGARYYCETVFKCNPKNIVSILLMNSKSQNFGRLVPPTTDLQQIQRALEYVHCPGDGETEFGRALLFAYSAFCRGPEHLKRRLLMFVGGTIQLHLGEASSYGEKLKASGVALDVLNLYCLEVDKTASVFEGIYHYAKTELETLVTDVDADGNSHLVDIPDNYESNVPRILESKLKEHLDYLEKKAAADEKNKSAAAARIVYMSKFKVHDLYQQKKAAADIEKKKIGKNKRAADEKNKSAADEKNKSAADEKNKSAADEKNKIVESHFVKPGRVHNKKTKSAADDEYGQAHARRTGKIKKKKREDSKY